MSRAGLVAAAAFVLFARRAQAADPVSAAHAAVPAPKDPSETSSVVPPRLIHAPDIPYPRGAEGDAVVVLAVTVTTTGTVRAVRVLDGEEPFVSAALRAAPTFRFEPATRDDRRISATIRFEVAFHAPPPAPVPAASEHAPAAPAVWHLLCPRMPMPPRWSSTDDVPRPWRRR